jgi:acyl-CoA thioester hydrolase
MARQVTLENTVMDDLYKPELFRHAMSMNVRFADLDALGHVNHAKYLTYMEQARMAYATDVWGWNGDMDKLGMIVARVAVDYRQPLFFNDSLQVMTRCARLGNKSFDLAYLIIRVGDEIVATGLTSMVAYDYTISATIPFPIEWRDRTLAYEPALS